MNAMSIAKIIIDICLLRGRPQDLPASTSLLWLAALSTVVVDYAGIASIYGHGGMRLLLVVIQVFLFAGVVWAVLQLRGHAERWLQTIIALFAANTIFSLILLPVLPQLALLIKQGSAPQASLQIGWEIYFALACSIWYFMVMTQVMRHALAWPLALSGLVSFASLVAVRLAEVMLHSFFSLPAPT